MSRRDERLARYEREVDAVLREMPRPEVPPALVERTLLRVATDAAPPEPGVTGDPREQPSYWASWRRINWLQPAFGAAMMVFFTVTVQSTVAEVYRGKPAPWEPRELSFEEPTRFTALLLEEPKETLFTRERLERLKKKVEEKAELTKMLKSTTLARRDSKPVKTQEQKKREVAEKFQKLFTGAGSGGGSILSSGGGGSLSGTLSNVIGTAGAGSATGGIAGLGIRGGPLAGGGAGVGRGLTSLGSVGRLGGGGMAYGSGVGLGVRGGGLGSVSGTALTLDPSSSESYSTIEGNRFIRVADEPLSTFSISVDTAAYANVRRFIDHGQLPPADAVRLEELVNYFDYDYAPPRDGRPFAVHTEVAAAPWAPARRLVRVGIKAREIDWRERPASNLVFLLDVSGSMQPANKLPLVKEAMKLLVDQLDGRDRVAIAIYAGASGVALETTSGSDKARIRAALDALRAGGSTNGAAGIQLAYDLAVSGFIEEGTNRVILVTDGDFNVGMSSHSELEQLVKRMAKSGVYLTALGVGMGNYKDSMLETLSKHGNGNYAYLDTLAEARKVLVEQLAGTLITVAKDVKIQVELNPAAVSAYRLLGYEHRLLAKEDFNDDGKDAGEIGAGHTVTALYEIVPQGEPVPGAGVDELKYQKPAQVSDAAHSGELLTVKLRYKRPEAEKSERIEVAVRDVAREIERASTDMRFASAVALFALGLRHDEHRGITENERLFAEVLDLAGSSLGKDANGYRRGFVELVEAARRVRPSASFVAPTGSLHVATPVIMGALPKELIQKVINENRAQVRYCYEVELQRDPAIQGTVAMRWIIGATGSVARVVATESTLKSKNVERCLAERIKTWRFPAPASGGIVEVNYPFVFKSN